MRAIEKPLTADRLRQLLHYDPITGLFIWKVTRGGRAKAGDIAGWLDRGYYFIIIDGVQYTAESLVPIYMHEFNPPDAIQVQKGLDIVNAYLGLALEDHRARKKAMD